MKVETLFNIRTITAFIQLHSSDFEVAKINDTAPPPSTSTSSSLSSDTNNHNNKLEYKINKCSKFLHDTQKIFENNGYNVQTVRIATNPFEEWLLSDDDDNANEKDFVNNDNDDIENNNDVVKDKLQALDKLLDTNGIYFCSLGPSTSNKHTIKYCPIIVQSSSKYSCSANIDEPHDITTSNCIVDCIDTISKNDSLGNFRFCAASNCKDFIPFFPAAKCCSINDNNDEDDAFMIRFGLGLENGKLVYELLKEAKTIDNLPHVFKDGMLNALTPLQNICIDIEKEQEDNDKYYKTKYLGIDTSINPSLEEKGSIALAIEQLDTISTFGDSGTLAVVSIITSVLQRSLSNINLIGYCGVMLPLCEDTRLSALAKSGHISTIHQLLMISSVCGVGIDTVPIAALNTAERKQRLSGLILDVVGIAYKWDKSLSCRVFPLLHYDVGMITNFDSPYLCNAKVLPI